MSLGGGTWESQNKVLPGAYINFVSNKAPEDFTGDRGIVAFPTSMAWGPEKEVMVVTKADFERQPYNFLLSKANDDSNLYFREIFRNAHTILFYRANTGAKASNQYCEAKYSGVRGNDLKTVISVNVDDDTKFDVKTYIKNGDYEELLDVQTIGELDKLVHTDYVTWKEGWEVQATLGEPLTGGTGAANDPITSEAYLEALDAIAAHRFNVLCLPTTSAELGDVVVEYTKHMRDNMGVKFQTVMFRKETADYEGVVSVENEVVARPGSSIRGLVCWVAGAIAGCPINASNTNKIYDGELEIVCKEKQTQLEDALESGKFIFHKVGQTIRVLSDINTLTTFTETKNKDFARNQTVRIVDQIANDFATIFNDKYNGKIPNNESGRLSLWSDLVSHHQDLERVGAIENFKSEDLTVAPGADKDSVVVNDAIKLVSAMEKLYVTVVIS